jgi:hypothetical protein
VLRRRLPGEHQIRNIYVSIGNFLNNFLPSILGRDPERIQKRRNSPLEASENIALL